MQAGQSEAAFGAMVLAYTRGPMTNVRIKVCGVTSIEDAQAAVDLGAAFIGLNFWSRSPRRIDPMRGRAIARAVRGRTSVVGVFVNQAMAEVEAIADRVELDLVQFHGDETAAEIAPWGERALKAVRFSGELDSDALDGYESAWGFVVEPRRESFGGTGRAWDYSAAKRLPRDRPFLLAGGLEPANVAAAVMACSPWGVDVCSGVESAPGVKDTEALWRFFEEVRRAAG